MRTLDILLISCEVSLILAWSENCVLTSKTYRKAVAAQRNNAALTEINNPTSATFKIRDTKLYVPVVTLSTQDDNKLLEQLRAEFQKTIKWNKYRSEITNQTKTDNLSYLIDPKFTKFNRLFVLSFPMKKIELLFKVLYTYC